MLAAPFTSGAMIFAFYAMQPYLLELYGDPNAFGIAGIAAAVVAIAQIVGALLVPRLRRIFRQRTEAMMVGISVSSVALILVGVVDNFWAAIALISVWALAFAATIPVRQSYLNGIVPSEQRATVLSFDALMGSAGGVVSQPALGRAADVWSYSATYGLTGLITAIALPFYGLARREKAASDPLGDPTTEPADTTATPAR